jgi:hypothetical protein
VFIVASLGETPKDVDAMAPFGDPINIGSGGGKPRCEGTVNIRPALCPTKNLSTIFSEANQSK